jgi:pimeloyl-ACP methyl ester carboxylesterase
MIDIGSGPPLVLVPGIQGRWEWLQPAVHALAERCRIITASLPGEAGGLCDIDPEAGFESYVDWVDALLDRAGVARAAICGVSYGGWIALHYAARRPARVTSLTLSSPPAPNWRPPCRVEWYLRAPRLMAPVFALSSPFRLYPEIAVAIPEPRARFAFGWQHLRRVTRYPFVAARMAERLRLAEGVDFAADCGRVTAPTQVVTGEKRLDRVVPVASSLEYLRAIPGARHTLLAGTGHIGLVTQPARYAPAVAAFVSEHATPSDPASATPPPTAAREATVAPEATVALVAKHAQ